MNTATEDMTIDMLDAAPVTHNTPALQASREVAPAAKMAGPMSNAIAFLQGGGDLAMLEKMMDLQERFDDKQKEKDFNEAFAAFKAEAVRIVKGTLIADGPLKGKKHANLFDVVGAVTPALSLHGLSASWKITKDEPQWMEVTCTLRHVGGHSESISMGGEPDTGPGRNKIQARASTNSYLERYTLLAILGMAASDGDDDGAGGGDFVPERRDVWAKKAAAAQTAKELQEVRRDGTAAFQAVKDRDGYALFAKQVKDRAAQLEQPHA
jgi:hypothetical protein